MRDTAFRIYSTVTGSFSYSTLKDLVLHIPNFSGKSYDEDLSVTQFIGTVDKNGASIYEGDIVKCSQGWLGLVNYYHSKAHFGCEEIVTCKVNSRGPQFDSWDELEVIGNIHENSDIVNGE